MLMIRYFSFFLFLANALVRSSFSHDKSRLVIHTSNSFRPNANALLGIYYVEFYIVLYRARLTLFICPSGILGGPRVFTLFIRFYYISDDG